MKIIKFLKKFSKMSLKKIKNKIKNLKYGKNCKIFSSSNIFDCEIGDNIFVSPFLKYKKIIMLVIIQEFQVIYQLVVMSKYGKIVLLDMELHL